MAEGSTANEALNIKDFIKRLEMIVVVEFCRKIMFLKSLRGKGVEAWKYNAHSINKQLWTQFLFFPVLSTFLEHVYPVLSTPATALVAWL